MKTLLFIFGASLMLLYSCFECYPGPSSFFIRVMDKESGEDLIYNNTFNKDSIHIFLKDDEDNYDVLTNVYTDTVNETARIDISILTAGKDKNGNNFYLYLDKDNVETLNTETEKQGDIKCSYYQTKVTGVNDEPISVYEYTLYK